MSFVQKRILVLPAASNPSINILISLLPNIFDKSLPILNVRSCLTPNGVTKI